MPMPDYIRPQKLMKKFQFFTFEVFRQDPRRIRSYRDLDAPEDEVTVIDYRTL